jgi:prepilin-type N-terminal cleavage/methylation domain-containing protein
MRKGFVLAEILVVIIILAVLASIAIPGFSKAKVKAEKNQAIAYLRAIRTSEKLYWAKWRAYLPLANTAAIRAQQGLEIQSSYTFAVTAPTTVTFTATATSDAAKTLILDQSGTWNGSDTPLPLT